MTSPSCPSPPAVRGDIYRRSPSCWVRRGSRYGWWKMKKRGKTPTRRQKSSPFMLLCRAEYPKSRRGFACGLQSDGSALCLVLVPFADWPTSSRKRGLVGNGRTKAVKGIRLQKAEVSSEGRGSLVWHRLPRVHWITRKLNMKTVQDALKAVKSTNTWFREKWIMKICI